MAPIASEELVKGVLEGRISAIARLITRAESGEKGSESALAEIYKRTGKAHIVGITGVPGSGKSTLVAELCKAIRAGGRKIGVIAVDPTSPFSGGAILGDRIRMGELGGDEGVFIRSMATRGALGGLSRATMPAIDILDAAGFDLIIIETVGVGQDEVDVVRAAHTTVVVSAPGLGDDIQAIKAGILEIADIHVVSKCDRPDANRTITELKTMLSLGVSLGDHADRPIPVIPTSAAGGEGIGDLMKSIDDHLTSLKAGDGYGERCYQMAEMRLLKAAEDILRDKFESNRDGKVQALAKRLAASEIAPEPAARQLLDEVWKETTL